MISVHYDEECGYGKIGLEHFIHTYGIILSEKSSVNLAYGDAGKNTGRSYNILVSNDSSNLDAFEDLIYYSPDIFNGVLNLENFHEFINSVPFISTGKNSINIKLDVFSFIGKCLSGDLEFFWKRISNSEREKLGRIPFIDVYERMLFLVLLRAFEELRLPFVCKAFWPGKRFAVCLTHDVDEVKKTYQWITRPFIYLQNMQADLFRGQLYSLYSRLQGNEPFWTFNEIMKIEDNLNVRSSFYFLKERSKAKVFAPGTWKLLGRRYDFNDPKVREIMKELYAGGWEIGLHGSYESYKNPDMLEKERNYLQTSFGGRISGTRQHHLNIEIPKTWEYHEKIGLEYDTTLGFKDQMGFRGGTCLPFHPYSEQKRLNLLEIPLAIMDAPLVQNKKEVLYGDFESMVNIVSGFNGVLTLLWHHSIFNEYEFPGWIGAYEKIINFSKKNNGWVTGAGEISDWWKWRERTGFEWDYEGTRLRITPYPKESSHFLNIYLPRKTIEKISNAVVIETSEDLFTIKTNILKNDGCVEIKFSEVNHGS